MSSAAVTLELGAERAPFVMLPTWLLRNRQVSDGAKVLYGLLHDLVAGREGPTRAVTRGELAECGGVSVDTVDRRLSELIRAGAVEKQAQFETRQGQLANVYWVRLSPPAAALRPAVDNADPPGRRPTAPPAAAVRPPEPRACGNPGRDGAAPREKEQDQEVPPQPPRSAGGRRWQPGSEAGPTEPGSAAPPASDGGILPLTGGRRLSGTSQRAVGANPRAVVAAAAAEQDRERAARLEAMAEAKTAARLAAERAGEAAIAAFEAEALAVSGALDDDRLAAVVAVVRDGLVGPLANSTVPVARAVVDWCRLAASAASVANAGCLAVAVDAALLAGQGLPTVPPAPLPLAAAPPGTVPLRRRVTTLMGSRVEEAV